MPPPGALTFLCLGPGETEPPGLSVTKPKDCIRAGICLIPRLKVLSTHSFLRMVLELLGVFGKNSNCTKKGWYLPGTTPGYVTPLLAELPKAQNEVLPPL